MRYSKCPFWLDIINIFQSQLVYQLSVLLSPPKRFHQTHEKLLFKYLWNNKPDKFKRVTMYTSKDQGGLNMPNIQYQDTSLKIAWVKRLVCQIELGKVSISPLTTRRIFSEANSNQKVKSGKMSYWHG